MTNSTVSLTETGTLSRGLLTRELLMGLEPGNDCFDSKVFEVLAKSLIEICSKISSSQQGANLLGPRANAPVGLKTREVF